MENVINYLLQFGQLNQQQIDLIKNKSQILKLKKEEYFSEAGKIAQQVAFVDSGILRVCYFNNKGEEITKYFIDELNFAVDLNSFTNQIPSSEYVQAVSNCKLYVFTAEDLKDFSNQIIGWDHIISQIIAKSLIEKINRISPMLAEDAKTRYSNFIGKFPRLISRIPLSSLASYLGVTQSSLSRIRKNIL